MVIDRVDLFLDIYLISFFMSSGHDLFVRKTPGFLTRVWVQTGMLNWARKTLTVIS